MSKVVIEEMDQRSEEWFKMRLGKITGSGVADLLKKGRGKDAMFGDMAKTYISSKIAEKLTGDVPDMVSSRATDWGIENEDYAIEIYESETWSSVETVGFVVRDEWTGCSPDGLVGADGIIEVKCPYNSTNHLKTIESGEVPAKHLPQVVFNTLICGRDWCDFISFDPRFPEASRLFVKRVLLSDHAELVEEMELRIAIATAEIKTRVERLSGSVK